MERSINGRESLAGSTIIESPLSPLSVVAVSMDDEASSAVFLDEQPISANIFRNNIAIANLLFIIAVCSNVVICRLLATLAKVWPPNENGKVIYMFYSTFYLQGIPKRLKRAVIELYGFKGK